MLFLKSSLYICIQVLKNLEINFGEEHTAMAAVVSGLAAH